MTHKTEEPELTMQGQISHFLDLLSGREQNCSSSDHSNVSFDFDRAIIGDKVGLGSTGSVCTATVPTTKNGVRVSPTTFAVKILAGSKDREKSFFRERHALSRLKDQPSVVRLYGSRENVLVGKSNAHLLFMEYCARGEFFEILSRFEHGLPEPVARYFARALWLTVTQCHAAGVHHRDIKPENILVAEDFSLRLADFGSALVGNQQSSCEYCGTEQYIAPEVGNSPSYSPAAADVWSTAITVFIILFGIPPVFESTNKCWYFRCIRDGNWQKFWNQQEKSRPLRKLDKQTKQFLQRALDPNPSTRPTAEEMLQDEWLNDSNVCADVESFFCQMGLFDF